MKKLGMMALAAFIAISGYSQTAQEKVEKQVKDPKRMENAGKADVITMDKKSIFDSTTFKNNSEAVDRVTTKASTKKKTCRKKAKRNQS